MIRWRIAAMRSGDLYHRIVSHTGNPSIFGGTNLNENIFSRGIDWVIASGDAYGYSAFPRFWAGDEMTTEDFCVRASSLATVGKEIWLSELQGAAAVLSGQYGAPVSGREQQ